MCCAIVGVTFEAGLRSGRWPRAIASPAFVRSETKASSTSAKACPARVIVSIASVRLLKTHANGPEILEQREECESERARRSRFQTTSASLGYRGGERPGELWQFAAGRSPFDEDLVAAGGFEPGAATPGSGAARNRSVSTIPPMTDRPVPRRPCDLPFCQHRPDLVTLVSRVHVYVQLI
jgi:hypothetical protein